MKADQLVLWLMLATGLSWLAYEVLRYACATKEMRTSMRQAWLIRWRWVRLSRMLGLTVLDPTPTFLKSLLHRDKNDPPAPRRLVPKIKLTPDEYGVIVEAWTLPKVGRDEWLKNGDHLANAWGCTRVSVLQDRPGRLRIRAVRRDPLLEPCEIKPSGLPPADLERWVPGRDEYAELVSERLSNVPGMVVAGAPGYGKTNVIAQFIIHFAPSEAVQFAIVDGKGGADYEDAAVRCFAWGVMT